MSALRALGETTRTRAGRLRNRATSHTRILGPVGRLRWELAARRPGPKGTFEGVDHHPWSAHAMDEMTGEVLDVRIRPGGHDRAVQELRREWSEKYGCFFTRRLFARQLTREEAWAARDRDEEWRERWRYEATGVERYRVVAPAQPPEGWEPDDEWDPVWEFCGAFAPGAIPVVFGGYEL